MDNIQSKIERKRKIRANIDKKNHLNPVADQSLVSKIMNSEVDDKQLDYIKNALVNENTLNTQELTTEDEVLEALNNIKEDFDSQRFNLLIQDCKSTTINQVVTTFGLGSFISFDKFGGEVTTTHNFNKGIVATEKDQNRYDNFKEGYNRSDYDSDFPDRRKEIFKTTEIIIDDYTNKELPKDGTTHIEHVVSANEIDRNSKNNLFMSKEERVTMSKEDSNLRLTNNSLNTSKKEKPMDEWLETEVKRTVNNEDGTTEKKIMKNKDYYEMDEKRVRELDIEARANMRKSQVKSQVKKQGYELSKTSAKASLKMGLQQSLGMLISEFASAVFDEINDIYINGFKSGNIDESFFKTLTIRMNTISKRLLEKRQDIAIAFKDGAISGFFSNLIAFVVNCFKTTAGRITRIVREGFMSLIKAFKLMTNPPEYMFKNQVSHEVTKLIGAAIVTTGGILIEESVEAFLRKIPLLGSFANFISIAIVGLVTGLTTTFVVYGIDKLDLFGVIRNEQHDFIVEKLDTSMKNSINNVENILIETGVI